MKIGLIACGKIYGAVAARIPTIAISHSQRAQAPELPIAAVIHHGVDPDAFPVGQGGGDYLLFLGRMAPEKGAHHAIAVAHRTGLRLLIAAKMREPAEHRYFAECVRPHLGDQIDYRGEVSPRGQDRPPRSRPGPARPHHLGRAIRATSPATGWSATTFASTTPSSSAAPAGRSPPRR